MIKASLRYFGAVVQHGSIRAAADALHVAQSAVSRQLQALEQELDVQLIERRARGFVPTPAGEMLFPYWPDSGLPRERPPFRTHPFPGPANGHLRYPPVAPLPHRPPPATRP